tara:strand:- start:4818 stop:5672 length:855 start_codon:yes stop_codon:yes gene_type:complete
MISITKQDPNYIEIKFKKGKDVNEILVNTIRRLVLSEVSSFAFHPDNITIGKNTSILNNDNIRHRISLLPIQKLKEKDYKSINITLALNESNKSSKINTITTDNCVIRVNNVIRRDMFPSPPVIIVNLKEDQEIELNATASYEKAFVHNMYAAAANSYFDESENYYTLFIEGLGQYSCEDIFKMACESYLEKLIKLQVFLKEHENYEDNFIEFKIENENHTLGCLFVHELQKLKDIEYAAYKMEHPSINNIEISITTNGSKNIKDVTNQVYKKLQDMFTNMIKL